MTTEIQAQMARLSGHHYIEGRYLPGSGTVHDVIDPATNPDFSKCFNNYAPGAGYQYCNLNFNIALGGNSEFW